MYFLEDLQNFVPSNDFFFLFFFIKVLNPVVNVFLILKKCEAFQLTENRRKNDNVLKIFNAC